MYAPETLGKLAREHKNLRGFKDASTDIINFQNDLLQVDPEDFDLVGGCDGFDGIMVLLGGVGCVSFMAVPFPREMKEIVDKGLAGDWKGCRGPAEGPAHTQHSQEDAVQRGLELGNAVWLRAPDHLSHGREARLGPP